MGNEHRDWHGSTRSDAAAADVSLAVVGTVTHVVVALACLVALVMHGSVCPSVSCLSWRAPRTGDTGLGGSGVGGQSRVWTHQLSVQPGPGAMCRAKDVAADVGNDANHDHVPVHVAHYSGRTRKETR